MGALTISLDASELPYRLNYKFGSALIRGLLEAAAVITDETVEAISGPSRKRELAYIRFAIMLVAREHRKPVALIARLLGRSDHTTVLSGVERARDLEKTDPVFAALVHCLRRVAEDASVIKITLGSPWKDER